MSQFIRKLSIKGLGCPEFHFNRIFTVKGIKYHVAVLDKASKSHIFTMEAAGSQWKIANAPEVPDWIVAMEKELSDTITSNNKR